MSQSGPPSGRQATTEVHLEPPVWTGADFPPLVAETTELNDPVNKRYLNDLFSVPTAWITKGNELKRGGYFDEFTLCRRETLVIGQNITKLDDFLMEEDPQLRDTLRRVVWRFGCTAVVTAHTAVMLALVYKALQNYESDIASNIRQYVFGKSGACTGRIGAKAFFGCQMLHEVVLSPVIYSIAPHAFAWCEKLTALELPEGLEHIGESAFAYCTSLATVSLPVSLTHIGKEAFASCVSLGRNNRNELTLPKSVVHIGEHAFENCRLSTIHAPRALERFLRRRTHMQSHGVQPDHETFYSDYWHSRALISISFYD